MKVVYTQEALADLDAILEFISAHYPGVYAAFEKRMQVVEARIGAWPESAPEVAHRPGVRVVPLIRYPYKIFYRIENDVGSGGSLRSSRGTPPPMGSGQINRGTISELIEDAVRSTYRRFFMGQGMPRPCKRTREDRRGDSGLEPLLEPALQAHVVVRPPAIIDGMRKLLVLGMGRHQPREPFVQ